jgi:phage FluMu protein Com
VAPCTGHAGTSRGEAARDDVRCDCGSLLARWTPDGLELKCRRCKRHVIVPIEEPTPDNK